MLTKQASIGGGRSAGSRRQYNAATRLVSRRATAPKRRPTTVQASVFLPVLTVRLCTGLEKSFCHFCPHAFVPSPALTPSFLLLLPTLNKCPRRCRRAICLRLHGSHVPLLCKCRRRDQISNLCLVVCLRPCLCSSQCPAFLPRQSHPHGSRDGADVCFLHRVHPKSQQRGSTTTSITMNE